MTTRASWDEYFMDVARTVATRGTCDRKQVGAVIVRERRILTTGYNGSASGTPHCDDVGHLMEHDHCVRTVHSEINALLQAARLGISIEMGTLYTTAFPCWNCMKAIASSGIWQVAFSEGYRVDEKVKELAEQSRVELRKI